MDQSWPARSSATIHHIILFTCDKAASNHRSPSQRPSQTSLNLATNLSCFLSIPGTMVFHKRSKGMTWSELPAVVSSHQNSILHFLNNFAQIDLKEFNPLPTLGVPFFGILKIIQNKPYKHRSSILLGVPFMYKIEPVFLTTVLDGSKNLLRRVHHFGRMTISWFPDDELH